MRVFILQFIVSIFINCFFPGFLFCSSKPEGKFFFPLQLGFPVEMDGWIETSVVSEDVDDDDNMEIAFNTHYPWKTYLVKYDGSNYNTSWPKDYGKGPPTIADINNDKQSEIITVDGELNVWKLDGSVINGWPYIFGNGSSWGTAAMDLDDNGIKEICSGFGAGAGDPYYFTILDHEGVPLPGYPVNTEVGGYDNPCIVDLNSDGFYEVIVENPSPQYYHIVAWDLSGNLFNGDWAVDLKAAGLGPPLSDITTADIDGDLKPEIMLGTDFDPIHDQYRHAVVLNHDKSFATGWPKEVHSWLYGGLSAGDVDGDGQLEVACSSSGDFEDSDFYSVVYIWRGIDGSDLPGWPKIVDDLSCTGQNVIIGDIDGDCDQEVIVACYSYSPRMTKIYAWHHDGTIVNGFPLTIDGFITLWRNSCFLTDLDNDGDVEIGIGVENESSPKLSRVYVWDLPGAYSRKCPPEWPQYNHDAQHTGNYHHPGGLPIVKVPGLSSFGILILLICISFFLMVQFYHREPHRQK